ncbi:MAG: DUF1015 domain-containing protein [Anaerolineae bacterium]|nr:DUF1015 domain-containing protein [Anaerolineae bacterium]
MAVIKPFRGVRYDPAKFDRLEVVVSQPYDKITDELAQQYDALSPYNIAHIIGGKRGGNGSSDPYAFAKACYDDWLAEGVLIREDRPALYAYEQQFALNGEMYTRLGLIAAVGLADFDEGIILPHERTHSGPKADRLNLLHALAVNTEQIFLLYPDDENRVNALIRAAIAGQEPVIDVHELHEHGVRQCLWVITDAATIAAIEAEMAPKRHLIIADGHHRYETALAYRDERHAAQPDLPPDAACNYTGAMLVSMTDPGLVVLPTHREVRDFTATSPADVLRRAEEHFIVTPAADLESCLQTVTAHPNNHAFGFYGGPAVGFHVLMLKPDRQVDDLVPGERSHEWKSLAVSVLHYVLLDQIAGLPAAGIEDRSLLRYYRSAQDAATNVDQGDGNFVFFVSPTRLDMIRACADQGEKMPQKSTDFYPKVISGLVMLPVGAGEVLPSSQPADA